MSLPIPFKTLNVLKAVIVPFKDKKLLIPVIPKVFVIPVNPETYDEDLQLNLDEGLASGSEFTPIRYLSTASQKLQLSFYLDGTNTIEGYFNPGNLPVLAQITRLKMAVYNVDSSTHRPYYLKIFWGSLVFCGVLSSMKITYTLFNPAGIPIRAKVNMNFTQHEDREKGAARLKLNSPDVTHVKSVEAGQRLDQLANEIYNDSKLMLQVAKANGLTSFRNVKAGTEITFPPIDKKTN